MAAHRSAPAAGSGRDAPAALEAPAATRLVHAFLAAVQARSLGVEERPRLRDSLAADFADRLRRILAGRPAVRLKVHPDGFQVDRCLVPAGQDSVALAAFLRDEGLRSIHFHRGVARETLERLLDVLGSYLAVRGHGSGGRGLWLRLLDEEFPGVSFGILRGLGPEDLSLRLAAAGDPEGAAADPFPAVREYWAVRHARLEAERDLAFEYGRLLLKDAASQEPRSPARRSELAALSRILRRLIEHGRPREALSLLDELETSPALETQERDRVRAVLDEFRRPETLRSFLAHLPPHPESTHAAFLMRLGPEIAPVLLSEAVRYRSASLHTLLETLVQLDPRPFHEILVDDKNPEAQERALELLENHPGGVPAPLLRRLARSPAPFLRMRALRRLVEAHPGDLEPEEALAFLEDPNEGVRIQALRRLAGAPPNPARFTALAAWFRLRQRDFSLAERRRALAALVAADPKAAVAFFATWFREKRLPWRRRSDHENRYCAVKVLAGLDLPEAEDLLRSIRNCADPRLAEQVRRLLRERHEGDSDRT